jgi:hypothetical protein
MRVATTILTAGLACIVLLLSTKRAHGEERECGRKANGNPLRNDESP